MNTRDCGHRGRGARRHGTAGNIPENDTADTVSLMERGVSGVASSRGTPASASGDSAASGADEWLGYGNGGPASRGGGFVGFRSQPTHKSNVTLAGRGAPGGAYCPTDSGPCLIGTRSALMRQPVQRGTALGQTLHQGEREPRITEADPVLDEEPADPPRR